MIDSTDQQSQTNYNKSMHILTILVSKTRRDYTI